MNKEENPRVAAVAAQDLPYWLQDEGSLSETRGRTTSTTSSSSSTRMTPPLRSVAYHGGATHDYRMIDRPVIPLQNTNTNTDADTQSKHCTRSKTSDHKTTDNSKKGCVYFTKALQANRDDPVLSKLLQGGNESLPKHDICIRNEKLYHKEGCTQTTTSTTSTMFLLEDFVRWSNQLDLASLPAVPDLDQGPPLLPTTSMVLPPGMLLSDVTHAIQEAFQTTLSQTNANQYHKWQQDIEAAAAAAAPATMCPFQLLLPSSSQHHHHGRLVLCSRTCSLKCVLQLWKKQQPPPEPVTMTNDEATSVRIVVELQRRRGCPVRMHHIRRRFFQALKQQTVVPNIIQPPQHHSDQQTKRNPSHTVVDATHFFQMPSSSSSSTTASNRNTFTTTNNNNNNNRLPPTPILSSIRRPNHIHERPSKFPPPLRFSVV